MERTTPIPKRKAIVTVAVEDRRKVTLAKYDKSVPERMFELSKLGLTIMQMAMAMGVKASTVDKWIAVRPGVSEAMEAGRWHFDHGVELALQQRAMGYEYDEVKVTEGYDNLGRYYKNTVTTTKKVAPDSVAGIFWLKNRQPERWMDSYRDLNTTNIMNIDMSKTLQLKSLSKEEQALMGSIAMKTIENLNGVSQD